MADHWAPPSLGFSRQERWSGVAISFSNAWKWKVKGKSCPTLHDPMDYSSPGSSVHGIFQARVLEWGAIAFSDLVIAVAPNDEDISLFIKICRWESHVLSFSPHLGDSVSVLLHITRSLLQSTIHRPAALISSGSLLKMQSLSSLPHPTLCPLS